jgi:hypothetical protein
MGTSLDTTREDVSSYKQAIYKMGNILILRFSRFWLQIPIMFNLSSYKKQSDVELDILHRFTTSIIREKRLARTEEDDKVDVESLNDDVLGRKKKMAMLDLLLKAEAEGKIDEDGIREEVDTFTFEVCNCDNVTQNITVSLFI